ncbi:hypothetical protein IWW51_000990, partial [Coemansia sp. RSA 2702]
DIGGALGSEDIGRALDLEKLTTHHWAIKPCSAVTGDNLLEGLKWIVGDIAAHIYMFA